VIGCESCVNRLEQLELEVAAMKTALRELQVEAAAKEAAKERAARRGWFSMPALSFAGALAAIALAVGVTPQLIRPTPADVSLTAYRGLENPTIPQGRPLHLRLNAADLGEGRVTVELVDQTGKRVWQGASEIKRAQVYADAPAVAQSGTMYVRIYSPASNNPEAELLREFSVQVK
jgi:hypothetical protein